MKLILEVVGDPFGFTAMLAVCLALASLGMVFFNAARGDLPRRLAAATLLAAAAYAALNFGLFAITFSRDGFAIFTVPYLLSAAVLMPALALALLLLVPRSNRHTARLGMIGFGCWVLSVSFAHLWVVAVAAASV